MVFTFSIFLLKKEVLDMQCDQDTALLGMK